MALTLKLERGCGADGGIKGDVTGLAVGWSGLDVAPPLTLGARRTSLASLTAGQLIKGGLQPPWAEIGSNRYRALRYLFIVLRSLLTDILRR
jgi:hypothetical protein